MIQQFKDMQCVWSFMIRQTAEWSTVTQALTEKEAMTEETREKSG